MFVERTADSHYYLKKQLDMAHISSPRQRGHSSRRRRHQSSGTSWANKTDPCDYSYASSVNRLRTLLRQTDHSPQSPVHSPRVS